MRTFNIFLFVLLFAGCGLLKNKKTFEGGGSYLVQVDSALKKDIQIIHLTHSTGVIFPAEYGKKVLGVNGLTKDCTFFTPDSVWVKKNELEIDRQYCTATKEYWKSILSGSKTDTSKHPQYIKDTTVALKAAAKFCANWQANQIYYDRQYIGYITPTGDKIIVVQLIDFRDDPHKYKQIFTSVWIAGWHGWYYSNIFIVYFNTNKNKLTIDKEAI